MNKYALLISFGFIVPSTCFAGSDLLLNEWNCVRDDCWLNNTDTCNTATCATDEDSFFGRRMGNGGDWIELVVLRDHADLRGWKLQWIVAAGGGSTTTPPPIASGTDIWWGDGTTAQGQITFTSASTWADVRAGTIITITRDSTAAGGLDTDLSFNPCASDWWINVNLSSTTLLESAWNITNVTGNKLYISHQNWWCQVVKANGDVAIGLVGEGLTNGGWAGSGVSKYEVGKLEETPGSTTSIYSNYQDANNSTFGAPNVWKSDAPADFDCRRRQDMTAIRATVRSELCGNCVPLVLNEYNAVKTAEFLGGGTQAGDANTPPGVASDAFFGRVAGNGGDWMELLVATDHLDMRNWSLDWAETGATGSIKLSNAAFWSDLRIGTIITFIQKTTALGGLNTDLSYNGTTDNWVNINTYDTALVTNTTSTKAGHVSGNFTTSNDRWTLTVRNAASTAVAGPVGEGSVAYNGGLVNSEDVCRLREDPTGKTDATAWYDDSGDASTFGRPNTWTGCPVATTVTQSFATLLTSGCVAAPAFLPADFDHNGHVDGADLGTLLGNWNLPGVTDLNHDGTTTGADLGIMLGFWG